MNQGRIVVVSNRLPLLNPTGKTEEVFSSYGLINSLISVMADSPGAIWMGWSGKTSSSREIAIEESSRGKVSFLSLDLHDKEAESFQHGFCHRTLWPICHLFQNRIKLDKQDQENYFKVNEKFARALIDRLEPDDLVWVNDYPLAPMGRFLRQEGFHGPIGFFLHVPFPPVEMIEILTDPLGFMDSWLHYDLVGFHTEPYVENYFEVMARLMLGVREGDRLFAGARRQRVITSPIGIDLATFQPEPGGETTPHHQRLTSLLPGCKVVIGVDRLDYTKGIPERLLCFEYFLKNYPAWKRKAALVQVCSPSRTRVKDYRDQKTEVDQLVGRINGELADHEWSPIRYVYRNYGQAELARFYRDSAVGLVTPLRDGMNLVAMEYVAAQDPADPGVLVLSRFTGVAEYLHEAVLVNPFLPDSVAEGIDRALTMSLRERQDRHEAMLDFVRRNTVTHWARTMLDSLSRAHHENLTI